MRNALTEIREIHTATEHHLAAAGRIFAVFGHETQDSGNVSYGVETAHGRYFVKTTDPSADVYLDFDARVALLRNAVQLARSCRHPSLPRLVNVIESPHGPMLVYEWVDGELLREPSAREKFRRLPVSEVLVCLDQILELHVELADSGRIAVDFYDGCLIYDFPAHRIHVVDLDGYHDGPFLNRMGRMFGSSRFMAPEEFRRGEWIDERTTVFNLGRAAAVLASDGSLEKAAFRGPASLYPVIARACRPSPVDRFQTVRQLHEAWRAAR